MELNELPVYLYPPIEPNLLRFLESVGLKQFIKLKENESPPATEEYYLVVTGQMEPRISAQRFRRLLCSLGKHHDWQHFVLNEGSQGYHWDKINGFDLYIEHRGADHPLPEAHDPLSLGCAYLARGGLHGRTGHLRCSRPLMVHCNHNQGIPFQWYLLAIFITIIVLILIHQVYRRKHQVEETQQGDSSPIGGAGLDHHARTNLLVIAAGAER